MRLLTHGYRGYLHEAHGYPGYHHEASSLIGTGRYSLDVLLDLMVIERYYHDAHGYQGYRREAFGSWVPVSTSIRLMGTGGTSMRLMDTRGAIMSLFSHGYQWLPL